MAAARLFISLALVAAAALAAPAAAQPKAAEYTIAAGDSIRIQVFQNPDLTLETRVTESGTISYPLLGAVRVGGMTLTDAERTIAKGLQDGGFIQQPQVIVLLLQNRGNQISVLGQVNRPGRFPLEHVTARLSEAVANAGGIAATGADLVIVTGVRDGKPFRREVDFTAMLLDDRPQDDVTVAGGDVIYVHRSPVFYIHGEVQRPGSYRLERGMTVRQALAQGGGVTQRGAERKLEIIRRNGSGAIEKLAADLNAPVRPDDTLYVPQSLF